MIRISAWMIMPKGDGNGSFCRGQLVAERGGVYFKQHLPRIDLCTFHIQALEQHPCNP